MLDSNREIRQEAFNLFCDVMKEKLEGATPVLHEIQQVATICLVAIQAFKDCSETMLGPIKEDCHLENNHD